MLRVVVWWCCNVGWRGGGKGVAIGWGGGGGGEEWVGWRGNWIVVWGGGGD